MRDGQEYVRLGEDGEEDALDDLDIQKIELFEGDEDRDFPLYTNYVLTPFVDAQMKRIPAIACSIKQYRDRDDCFETTKISLGVFAKGATDNFIELNVIIDTQNETKKVEALPLLYAYIFKKQIEWAIYDKISRK